MIDGYELEIGKKGFLTLKHNNIYIYSSYDPIIEAKRFISSHKNLKKTIITCCGLDYVNRELLELDIYDIISFNPIKFTDEKLPNITYVDNLIDLEKEILKRDSKELSLLLWSKLIESNPNFYIPKLKKINEIVEKVAYSKNTESYFGFIETKNSLRNLNNIDEINILSKDNRDRKFALIVSSGNSLKDNIDFIKTIKEKIYIFALPSSLPYLSKNGIEPDYAIAVDSGFATYYHLSKYRKKLNLLCPITIHPALFKLNNYSKIIFSYGTILEEKLYEENMEIIKSISEGSVFINLIRILKQLNFSDAILVGQDFGYYKNRGHIDGGFFEPLFLERSNLINTIETQFKLLETKKDITYIENNNIKIKTDRSLKIYYNHFIENDFSLNFYSTPHSNFTNNSKIKIVDSKFFDDFNKIEKRLSTKKIDISTSKNRLLSELKNGFKKDNSMLKHIYCNIDNSLHNITIKKLLKEI